MPLTEQLNRYLQLLVERGSQISDALNPPISDQVRDELLQSVDLDIPATVLEIWDWRDGGGGWSEPDLFWETGELLSMAAAIAFRANLQAAVDTADLDLEWRERADSRQAFPGPRSFLPLLMLDEREVVAVDCGATSSRGSVWFMFSSEEPELLFADLTEAIDAAIYCVESGQWQVDANGINRESNDDLPPSGGDTSS